MTRAADRAGRWLIRRRYDRLADLLACLVMRRRGASADPYLPLWRERWTVRDAPVAGVPGDAPAGITADCGAMRLLGRGGSVSP